MPAADTIAVSRVAVARLRPGLVAQAIRWLPRSSERGLKRAHFQQPWIAASLLAPQLIVLLFFFFIPSFKAVSLAFVQVDSFGGTTLFVGFDNFASLFASPEYRSSVLFTIWFTLVQSLATIGLAGLLAFATDHVLRGKQIYKGVILIPYAIAPVISGVLWAFLFNPAVGPVAHWIQALGFRWDPNRDPWDAQLLVIISSVWSHICYDYIFFVASLLAVPQSLLEAATLDGAGPVRRFFSVSLPLIMPTTFFLIVMNFVFGMFETFGIIDATTRGGPGVATTNLVYKVYQDGFVQLNLGSSAAQSVILMIAAVLFTVLQFRALERRVNYQV